MAIDSVHAYISERARRDAGYPALVRGLALNDELLDALVEKRTELGVSGRELAGRMETSQPSIARLESGDVDPRLSTIQRYAAALAYVVKWELIEATSKTFEGSADRHAAPVMAQ